MWFYIILLMWCILALIINNQLKHQKDKKIFEVLTIFVLCIVSGTRYYLGGTDYYVYKTIYDDIPNIFTFFKNYENIHEYYNTFGVEKGYLFFNSFIKSLGFNFFGFTLIHSIIFYFCFYIGLRKYTSNFNLVILIFMYKIFFYNTFISMRQSITIAIFFLAMNYIVEKKPFKYFVFIFIACFFHNGALILFFVYFINKVKLTKRLVILLNVIFIPSTIVSILNLPIMKFFDFFINFYQNPTSIKKAQTLFTEASTSSIGIFNSLEYFLIMLFVIICFDKLIKIDKNSEFIIKLFLLLLPIFTLFRGYEILTRTKDYFILTYAIIIGYLCLIDNGKYKTIVQITTIFVCTYGFFRFIILFDGGAMVPYESYILKGVSIFGD